jgi:Bacterial DNA polymerase III alpha subunit finger domain
VTITRAELNGTALRLEGSAAPNRVITVDGVAMVTSDSGGRFKIQRDPFAAPADCIVDVNDGSATPTAARLAGCTVTTAMATVGIEAEPDEATQAAAWRLLEAGDTLGISQVESVGFRMLLKRAHELAKVQSQRGHALTCVEDLAQLLALWKLGVYSKDREDGYFDARFASRERPTYPHPAMAAVIRRTARSCTPLCRHSKGSASWAKLY